MILDLLSHNASLALALITAIVLAGGAACQLLSVRLRMPAILPLLGLGLLLGPEGLGLIQPEAFGAGLRALVSLAVAVIVFEGALLIDVRHLRHCSRAVLGLLTVGVGTTFLGAGLLGHYVLGMPPKIGLLFGAVVCMTGPTVITPILKRLPVTRRIKTTLEAESVFADAIGVLLTAAVFAYITGSADGVTGGVLQLGTNLAIGGGVGLLTAGTLYATLRLAGTIAPDLARVSALGIVLLGYAVSQALAHESGIAAVAVAGLVAGAIRLPHEDAIRAFKGDLSLVALSLVFILLAASMHVGDLVALGPGGLLVVLGLIFVVRPLAVGLATLGSGLAFRERAFIAWMGPRGIVAASLATLMGLELQAWQIQGSDQLAPLTFLTVMVTVAVEGGLAGWVARRLGVMPKKVLIAGGDEIARGLGVQLAEDGEVVVLVAATPAEAQLALGEGLQVVQGDPADAATLVRAGLNWTHTVVAATARDDANLMICQVARTRQPQARLVARVNDGARRDAFREAGIETLSMADAAVMSLSMLISRPTTLQLLGLSGSPERIVEVRVANTAFDRQPLVRLDLPNECLVALVKRGTDVTIPDGRTELRVGDTVTLIGEREAVELLRARLESEV